MAGSYVINPQVDCVPFSGTEYLVRSGHLEGYSLVVTDEGDGIADAVLRRTTDRFTPEEIADETGQTVETIEQHLDDLLAAGVIVVTEPNVHEAPWVAFARFGTVPDPDSLREIAIFGDGLAETLGQSLSELGLTATVAPSADIGDLKRFAVVEEAPAEGEDPVGGIPDTQPLVIVARSGQSIAEMQRINTDAVAAGTPVLYLQTAGAHVIVGPYVHPGSSACFWEFELQRSRSMFDLSQYQTMLASEGSRADASPFVEVSAATAAVPWIIELASTGRSSLLGKALMGRATTGELATQTILRLPRCPVCLPTRPLLRNAQI